MAELVITRRMAAPAERARLHSGVGGSIGCIAFWLLPLTTALGSAAGLTGWMIGLGVFVAIALAFWRDSADHRARVERDRSAGEVEEWAVRTGRVVMLGPDHESVDPAVLIDVGDGRVLLLCGQWLRDPETYGAPPLETDPEDDYDELAPLNGLPPPHTFPCTEFVIKRWPETGEVLAIRAAGEALRSEQVVGVELAERRPRPSQVLAGSVDDVDGVMRQLEQQG